MHLHFQRYVGQDPITGDLSRYDLHDFGPTFELLVEPLNDVGGPQGDPFLRGKVEKGQAGIDAALQAFHSGRYDLLPFLAEGLKTFPRLLP